MDSSLDTQNDQSMNSQQASSLTNTDFHDYAAENNAIPDELSEEPDKEPNKKSAEPKENRPSIKTDKLDEIKNQLKEMNLMLLGMGELILKTNTCSMQISSAIGVKSPTDRTLKNEILDLRQMATRSNALLNENNQQCRTTRILAEGTSLAATFIAGCAVCYFVYYHGRK